LETTKPHETKEERELPLLPKEEKELGFLLLGVVFGAVLGILGGLWVSFLVELLSDFIPQELWTVTSFSGLIITTILSIYTLMKAIQMATKLIRGEEEAHKHQSR